MCRKHYGSLFGTSLGVANAAFCWLAGKNEIVHYRATRAFERPFCRQCGSTVPGVSEEEGYWNVPAGLLDDDPGGAALPSPPQGIPRRARISRQSLGAGIEASDSRF